MNGVKLLLLIVGLNISFLKWGLLQERITMGTFEVFVEDLYTSFTYKFKNVFFLNALQSLVCALVAFTILFGQFIFRFMLRRKQSSFCRQVLNRPSSKGDYPSFRTFLNLGCSFALGPSIGLLSLRFISYPLYLLIKTSKMLPNILIGYFYYGHLYERRRIFSALIITIGLIGFAVLENKTYGQTVGSLSVEAIVESLQETFLEFSADPFAFLAESLQKASTAALSCDLSVMAGVSLVVANLFIDAFTSSTQDELVMRYAFNSTQLMFLTNFFAFLILLSVCIFSEVLLHIPGDTLADSLASCVAMASSGIPEYLNGFSIWIQTSIETVRTESLSTLGTLAYDWAAQLCANLWTTVYEHSLPSRVVPMMTDNDIQSRALPPQIFPSLLLFQSSVDFQTTLATYLASGVMGQLFLFVIQNAAGSLFVVAVNMVRKFLSILISLINAQVNQEGSSSDLKKFLPVLLILAGIGIEFYTTCRRTSKKAKSS